MLTLLTAPVEPPIDLDEAKAHLNIIGGDDNDLLERLIAAATQSLDGPEGCLGRALVRQRWRLTLVSSFPGMIRLPLPPTLEIEEIAYVDASGAEQTFEDYRTVGLGSTDGAVILPQTSFPSGARQVDVTYWCGFPDQYSVPEDIRNALLAIVGTHYAWRESTVLAQGTFGPQPEIDAMLDRWRVRGFGA